MRKTRLLRKKAKYIDEKSIMALVGTADFRKFLLSTFNCQYYPNGKAFKDAICKNFKTKYPAYEKAENKHICTLLNEKGIIRGINSLNDNSGVFLITYDDGAKYVQSFMSKKNLVDLIIARIERLDPSCELINDFLESQNIVSKNEDPEDFDFREHLKKSIRSVKFENDVLKKQLHWKFYIQAKDFWEDLLKKCKVEEPDKYNVNDNKADNTEEKGNSVIEPERIYKPKKSKVNNNDLIKMLKEEKADELGIDENWTGGLIEVPSPSNPSDKEYYEYRTLDDIVDNLVDYCNYYLPARMLINKECFSNTKFKLDGNN